MTRLLNTSYSYIKKTKDTELDTSCSRVIFNDESIYTVFISIKVIRVTKIRRYKLGKADSIYSKLIILDLYQGWIRLMACSNNISTYITRLNFIIN